MTTALEGGEGSASPPGRSLPPGKTGYPLYRRLGGPQGRSGQVYIWNKEELPEEWKESIIVPIYKRGDKTDCRKYRSISLLPTTYNILSNILLSRLTPYIQEIIGDHQCGFR